MSRNISRNSRSATPSIRIMPIAVEEAGNGNPSAIRLLAHWELINAVTSQWYVTEELAGEQRPIKAYFRVTIAGDQHLTVFRNMVTGRWYLEESAQ